MIRMVISSNNGKSRTDQSIHGDATAAAMTVAATGFSKSLRGSGTSAELMDLFIGEKDVIKGILSLIVRQHIRSDRSMSSISIQTIAVFYDQQCQDS